MANRSYRADGKEEITLKVECGSKPGFSTGGWISSSTYHINVIATDPFMRIIEQIKDKAGQQARAEEIFGVDKRSGATIKFDLSKSVQENGITPTSHPTMRFPSKFA